ncbi:MAG: hypothetical protein MJ185_03890 [Treponema sp.]|nr:hypothetical protein [Treponema sp.]
MKYNNNEIAIFNDADFDTYVTSDGKIGLLTNDLDLANKYGFYKDDDIFYREVSPYEVTAYYEQHYEAKYKGRHVAIWEGTDEKVTIVPDPEDMKYEELEVFGFEMVEKGVWQKKVPVSELTDILCIKKDILESAKEDYDSEHK